MIVIRTTKFDIIDALQLLLSGSLTKIPFTLYFNHKKKPVLLLLLLQLILARTCMNFILHEAEIDWAKQHLILCDYGVALQNGFLRLRKYLFLGKRPFSILQKNNVELVCRPWEKIGTLATILRNVLRITKMICPCKFFEWVFIVYSNKNNRYFTLCSHFPN